MIFKLPCEPSRLAGNLELLCGRWYLSQFGEYQSESLDSSAFFITASWFLLQFRIAV